jgi:hypothetical protein
LQWRKKEGIISGHKQDAILESLMQMKGQTLFLCKYKEIRILKFLAHKINIYSKRKGEKYISPIYKARV